MPPRAPASTEQRNTLSAHVEREGLGKTAREIGIDRETVSRVLAGASVARRTLVALDRIMPKVRQADEFRGLDQTIRAPILKQGPWPWDLEAIRMARDAQVRGDFSLPVRLAEAMRSDDAIFNARRNRLAALAAIGARMAPASGARAEVITRKAAVSISCPADVLKGIHGTLIDHGHAIGFVIQEPNEDGTAIDFRLEEWPLEYVKWIPSERRLITQVENAPPVPILHGNGQWIHFRGAAVKPWASTDACILAAALAWAAHANGIKDWAASSNAHALAKMIGEMAPGVALADDKGTLTPQARAFLRFLQDIASGDSPVGIRPAGAKTDFVANDSTAWQIFDTLTSGREKAIARIFLGTDAILGSVGGAPGVDIAQLFGISSTILQGDAKVIQQGLRTGLYEPWTAVNFGDSRYAPSLVFDLPDADAEKKREQTASALDRMFKAIDSYKKNGMTIDQDVVDCLSRKFGVDEPPKLAPVASVAVPFEVAPTDRIKVTTANEIRGASGLPAWPTDRGGDLTIPELEERAKAKAAAAQAAAQAAASAQAGAAPAAPAPAAS